MNRRFGFIFLSGLALFFLLHDCKPEKPAPAAPNDPDSLYVGTPYSITAPYGFPPVPNTPEVKMLTNEGIELGRMLFYDPVLSSDSQFSCSSCHKQQHAFSDSGNVLSKNFFGFTKRNTPALMNLVWQPAYFWDGRATTLPAQASDAMVHEMNYTSSVAISKIEKNPTYVRLFKHAFGRPGAITDDKIQEALTEFEITLISAESRFDSFVRGQINLTNTEDSGFAFVFLADTIVHGGDCFHCHASNSAGNIFTMVDNRFHNNALDSSNTFYDFPDLGEGAIDGNKLDNGKFLTPQFRNIALTGPYMRDGRFKTLLQVINFYNDSLKESPTVDPFMKTAYRGGLHYLTSSQIQQLIAFMNTLTDYNFVNNPAYSNPFK